MSFKTFFVWALLLIVHTWNSSPLRSNLLRLQCSCCTVPTTSGRPHGCPLCPLCPLWQEWSCGLVHRPGGNATDPIWRVLSSSDGISSWTPLKPQHSIHNPNQLWSFDFFTPPTPLIIPYRLPAFHQYLLCHSKTDARFVQDGRKAVWSIPYVYVAFFRSLKHKFIAYRSSKVSDCIFEIHQLWQSRFIWVYSNWCCRCSFKPEIIKIGQSSHKMYSNNILNIQESTSILNAHKKKVWKLIVCTSY